MAEASTKGNLHLTSGRLLARNTLWNLVGNGAPLAVAVFAIPILIHGLGRDRFGVLALAWGLVGYAGMFDLGLGRALTQMVAKKLGAGEDHEVPALAWTSILLMLGLGLLGGVVIAVLSPWLVFHALKIPEGLQPETLHVFYLLALSLPIVTGTSGVRGMLEAQQRFAILNAIRTPIGIFALVGPLVVLFFSNRLVPIISVLVIGRLLVGFAYLAACLHIMPALRRGCALRSSLVFPVLRFGGWMTVSNLVSPIMTYLDRFLIGALLSVGAVAYYTVPFDLVSRLSVLPGAFMGVLFPAFALAFTQDSSRAGLLLARGVKYIFLGVFPIILVIVTLAPEGLRLWLGPTFAENGSSVLRWLAAGSLVNCLALTPFSLIQGADRPDITAKLHLLELPLFLLALWSLVRFHGIEGAAIAWVGRVTLDAILLFYFAQRLLPPNPAFLRKLWFSVATALVVLCAACFPNGLLGRVAFLLVTMILFGIAAWLFTLTAGERAFVLRTRRGAPVIQETLGDAF